MLLSMCLSVHLFVRSSVATATTQCNKRTNETVSRLCFLPVVKTPPVILELDLFAQKSMKSDVVKAKILRLKPQPWRLYPRSRPSSIRPEHTGCSYLSFTSDKGGGKCFCPCLFVCLSVSKIIQKCVHGFGFEMLKCWIWNRFEMLRVDRCRDMDELINFWVRSGS